MYQLAFFTFIKCCVLLTARICLTYYTRCCDDSVVSADVWGAAWSTG